MGTCCVRPESASEKPFGSPYASLGRRPYGICSVTVVCAAIFTGELALGTRSLKNAMLPCRLIANTLLWACVSVDGSRRF